MDFLIALVFFIIFYPIYKFGGTIAKLCVVCFLLFIMFCGFGMGFGWSIHQFFSRPSDRREAVFLLGLSLFFLVFANWLIYKQWKRNPSDLKVLQSKLTGEELEKRLDYGRKEAKALFITEAIGLALGLVAGLIIA